MISVMNREIRVKIFQCNVKQDAPLKQHQRDFAHDDWQMHI